MSLNCQNEKDKLLNLLLKHEVDIKLINAGIVNDYNDYNRLYKTKHWFVKENLLDKETFDFIRKELKNA